MSYERVESTYQKYRDTIITIHAYGTFIETTTEHPFFVKGEWRRADALKAGMLLTLASGEEAEIEKVEMRLEHTAVYNFSVANNHTYTVGNVQFLVHNCGGTGKYSKVGGHHVHAKAGFKNHATYDPKKGFSVSQEFMKEHKLDHDAMTRKQRQLFSELAKSGKPNTLAEHTRIAKEALVAGGASKELADQLVKESLKNLKEQVVDAPSHIPWKK